MTLHAHVSVSCSDRVGLIAAISGQIFDLGGNLGETAFNVLGGTAKFSAIVEFPKGTDIEVVQSELGDVPELSDALVVVAPVASSPPSAPSTDVTHALTIFGGDRPGLVARLCEAFIDYGANIVRLEAESTRTPHGTEYTVEIEVHIPAKKTAACLATVTNTAGSLGLSCHTRDVTG